MTIAGHRPAGPCTARWDPQLGLVEVGKDERGSDDVCGYVVDHVVQNRPGDLTA